MPSHHAQLIACRRLAIEQNKKLFEKANQLNRSAFDLLERADLDSEQFHNYLRMRGIAEALFREAIDHLALLNEHFPPITTHSASASPTPLPQKETID